MSDVVFILGAGASRSCGGPLMWDFLDIASDLLQYGLVRDKEEQFKTVFDTIGKLQIVHSKAQLDLSNIETIFTAFELGKVIQFLPGVVPQGIPNVIAALKTLIVKTLEMRIPFPWDGRHVFAPAVYQAFVELVQRIRSHSSLRRTVSIMTFNYDVALDYALQERNLAINYALDGGNPEAISLLKLHGSLNWGVDDDRRIYPLSVTEYLLHNERSLDIREGSAFVDIGTGIQDYFRRKRTNTPINNEPVIVPPSWNKADYHQALTNVWASAAKNLSEAQHIFVIGYSMPSTDSFFRNLFALGSVSNRPLKQFVVFDPDQSGTVEARFRELLGPGAESRFRKVDCIFDEAISHLHNIFGV